MTLTAPSRACQAADPSSCKYHGDLSRKSRQDSLLDSIRGLLDGSRSSCGVVGSPSTAVMMPDTFTLSNLHGQPFGIKVSSPGERAYSCRSCDSPFSKKMDDEFWGEAGETDCAACGEHIDWDGCREPREDQGRHTWLPPFNVKLQFDNAHFLMDDRAVLDSKWYHSTASETWMEDVLSSDVQVHLGTAQAARDRAIDVGDRNQRIGKEKSFVYELRFKEGVEVDSRVFEYENKWDEEGTNARYGKPVVPYSRTRVNRYVNEWEAPGQVSLLVHPSLIEVVSVREIQ